MVEKYKKNPKNFNIFYESCKAKNCKKKGMFNLKKLHRTPQKNKITGINNEKKKNF